MPDATIALDAALQERLSKLASRRGLRAEEIVGTPLRRVAETDVRLEHGVPVFPRWPGAPTLTAESVDGLAESFLPANVHTR